MNKIWVTGEALIDFVPNTSSDALLFRTCCGGSTYNAAKAAARQGANVSFIGPISTDLFGDILAQDLLSEKIDISHAPRIEDPTTLAFVKYDGPDARYAFFDNASAMRMGRQGQIAQLVTPGDIVHAGSISLINDPGGEGIVETMLSSYGDALLSIDPNARAGMIHDLKRWRDRINALIERAALVKMSVEDLELLAPNNTPEEYAVKLIKQGVPLVVITLGSKGALAASQHGKAKVAVSTEAIVDTVGAGDTVTGTLLFEITRRGLKTSTSIASLDDKALEAMLKRAMRAAWLNCQQTGCNPPTADLIDSISGS
jgi:fructokinase